MGFATNRINGTKVTICEERKYGVDDTWYDMTDMEKHIPQCSQLLSLKKQCERMRPLKKKH